MHAAIAHFSFQTDAFIDEPSARAARVNEDIGSMALADWLVRSLNVLGFDASAPWDEDHGCDFSIVRDGRKYLCVCFTDDSEEELSRPQRSAGVSLDLNRSLMDKVRGRNIAASNDDVAAAIGACLRTHAQVYDLVRE